MARSSCVKCGGVGFEVVEAVPAKANYKVWFIQCANCGGVVSAMEYALVGPLIYKLAKKLNVDLDRP